MDGRRTEGLAYELIEVMGQNDVIKNTFVIRKPERKLNYDTKIPSPKATVVYLRLRLRLADQRTVIEMALKLGELKT